MAGENANENIVVRTREGCAQLFFVYAGARGMPGLPGLAFMKKSGLADRNLVLLRDPHLANFARGVGGGIDSVEALVDWQFELIGALPHVSEVYCLGNSMGGYAAVLAGHLLGVQQVFAFSMEIARAADPHAIERLGELLLDGDGSTRHNLYYLLQNDVDRANAQALEGRAGVRLHPLDGNQGLDCGEDAEDSLDRFGTHQAMNYLARVDRLREVFPAFRGAPGGDPIT